MKALIGSGRNPPLGGLTARPSPYDFSGRLTAPDALVHWTVEPALVTSFPGVHDDQGHTAPILTLIPGLATFLLAPAGALGLASVPCTPTGVRFRMTLPTTLLECVLGRRWRRFTIDFNAEDRAIVCGSLRLLPIRHAIFAHPDDEMLDGFTGRSPAIKTSKEPNRCRQAHSCGQAGDSAHHPGATSITCPSATGLDRVAASSTFPNQVMPPRTDVPINGFDSSRNTTPFVIFVFFSPY